MGLVLIEVNVSATDWLFLTVTVEAELFFPMTSLPKEIEVGVTVTAAIPVPLSATLCGLFDALSVIFRLPLRAPSAAGVNTTEIVQLFPAASVEGLIGQLFVWPKSDRVVAILLIVSAALWPFLNVTF